MSNIPFSCPDCGNETFKTNSQPKSIEEFSGAVCTKCGRVITDVDVRTQGHKIAERLARDAFKKAGF